MATRPSLPAFGQGLNGAAPSDWADTAAVDGDRPPWSRAPQGARYQRFVNANQVEWYEKIKSDGRNDDWVMEGRIAQRIDFSEFTDGGSATGTLVLDAVLPIGAYVLRSFLVNNTVAGGVSTLTIQVGDGTDADRYSTGTPSVAAAANIINLGAVSGAAVHVAAISTVTVTLTEDDDFTDITAWAATVVIEYTGSAI